MLGSDNFNSLSACGEIRYHASSLARFGSRLRWIAKGDIVHYGPNTRMSPRMFGTGFAPAAC